VGKYACRVLFLLHWEQVAVPLVLAGLSPYHPTMAIGSDHRSLLLALFVEGGLGALAFAIGWITGHWPAPGMGWSSPPMSDQLGAIGIGVVATIPLLLALGIIDRLPIGPLDRVRQIAQEAISLMFERPRIWRLALLAGVAGLGEELLFRGLVQAGLARMISIEGGPWIALLTASALFGAFHWLNTTYALLAAVAGMYFGTLLLVTASLWPPIVAHGLYDFAALWYLTRSNQMLGLQV
jgi:CAAX protease family protein